MEMGGRGLRETFAYNVLPLPTGTSDRQRDFAGQRFPRHVAAATDWRNWRVDGFVCRDTGIAEATGGLAGARVVAPRGATRTPIGSHEIGRASCRERG